MSKHTYKQLIAEAERIRKKLSLTCSQIQNSLQFQKQQLNNYSTFWLCNSQKIQTSPQFKRAFYKLSEQQRAEIMFDLTVLRTSIVGNTLPMFEEQIEVFMKDDKLYKDWAFCRIKFQQPTTFVIGNVGQEINLQHYMLRASRCKDRQAFALQAMQRGVTPVTIRISNSASMEYNTLKDQFASMCQQALANKYQRICSKVIINIDKSRRSSQIKGYDNDENNTDYFWKMSNRKSLRKSITQNPLPFSFEESDKISATLAPEELLKQLHFYEDFKEVRPNVYYHNWLNIVRKVFEIKHSRVSFEYFTNQLLRFDLFKNWKPTLCMSTLLSQFPSQNTKIFQQLHSFSQNVQAQMIYLRHRFVKQFYLYYIDKSISRSEYGSPYGQSSSRAEIEYCIWRFKELSANEFEVVIQANISHLPGKQIKDTIDQFIGFFQNIDDVPIQCQSDDRQVTSLNTKLFQNSLELIQDKPETDQKIVDKKESIYLEQFYSIQQPLP